MSEGTVKKNNTLIIAIIVAAVVVVAALVTVIVLLLGREDAPVDPVEKYLSGGKILYQEGVIALNQEDIQAAFDAARKKTEEGYITVDFNNWAESNDGKEFICYLGNSAENTYDVYFNMYLDSTLSQQILLTGLIPPGSGIDTFTSEVRLDPGEYEAVLVLTQVEDDHSTIHSQTNLGITLVVNG